MFSAVILPNCAKRNPKEYRYLLISLGELEAGLVTVAAPIFNAKSEVAGCMFIVAPSVRADYNVIEKMSEATRRHAAELSHLLGYAT